MRKISRNVSSSLVGLMISTTWVALDSQTAFASQSLAVIPGIGAGGYNVAPGTAQGDYGGGFIEFLVNGGSVAPPMSPPVQRAVAPTYGAPPSPAYAHIEGYNASAPEDVSVAPSPVDGEFERQIVDYDGRERPGTIIIDTPRKFLFLVQPGGRAIRYGIGVGRPGFEWSGVKAISRKAEWPGWTPPPQMMLRRPDLPSHMDGGPGNPLGARALYLGSSLYRIHGTNEPETIGKNVSSGCIRMMNQDVIDLYNRVPVGTKVIVI
jgi:lipoprotein-anchoring transpeptidase ErfK/SrfK